MGLALAGQEAAARAASGTQMRAFMKMADVYEDDDGGVWTVCYEGLSICHNDVVTFQGHIRGIPYGKTLDRPDAYALRASGKLRKRGHMDLFQSNASVSIPGGEPGYAPRECSANKEEP
jgi:hypothetical protein